MSGICRRSGVARPILELVALCLLALAPAWAGAQSAPGAPAQLSVEGVLGNVVTLSWEAPVSYTHLTLPTNREV